MLVIKINKTADLNTLLTTKGTTSCQNSDYQNQPITVNQWATCFLFFIEWIPMLITKKKYSELSACGHPAITETHNNRQNSDLHL